MTLDLKLTEDEISKLFVNKNFGEISLSRKVKINGKQDRYPNAKFYNDWMDRTLSLDDFSLGAYLSIRDVFDYAIENAVCHGGNRILVSFRHSNNFVFGSVKDNGNGFDVSKTLNAFSRGKKYFKGSGQGLQTMSESRAMVSFNSKGNKNLILYKIDPDRTDAVVDKARDYRNFLKMLGSK